MKKVASQKVASQAELDAGIAAGETNFELTTDVTFSVHVAARLFTRVNATVVARGSSSPRVEARGSSSPRVEAWESSSPRVVARGSSSPTVVAWGSSSPTVVARGSSSPTVVAWGSSSPTVDAWESSSPRVDAWESSSPRVVAWESSRPTVEAWGNALLRLVGAVVAKAASSVGVYLHGAASCEGGMQIRERPIETAGQWCEHFGAEIRDGFAVLVKAVDGEWRSVRGAIYRPGTRTEASDWDGGKAECGGGLHFCANIYHTREFMSAPGHFVRCLVPIDQIAVHANPQYPNKIKAPWCLCECELDQDGEPIGEVLAMPDETIQSNE